MASDIGEAGFFACCSSTRFAQEMADAGPFLRLDDAVRAARHIWMNKIDVNGLLEAFAAHPQIGDPASAAKKTEGSARWSAGEQSTAIATATESTLQELYEWNVRYKERFGFVFLICASGRSTPEILAELKKRYANRPIVELEIASQEQMKITEIRLAKLFTAEVSSDSSPSLKSSGVSSTTAAEERLPILGAHLTGGTKASATIDGKADVSSHPSNRTRPPITTHILDTSRGCPASGVEVHLEMWRGSMTGRPTFKGSDCGWASLGSSHTNSDGRSGALMDIVDISPGFYRISFNTGVYNPHGFFPFVSIVFEIKESQSTEHFHVPLLLSPFSFSTYRGS